MDVVHHLSPAIAQQLAALVTLAVIEVFLCILVIKWTFKE